MKRRMNMIAIPNVGSPPDDPNCILPGFLFPSSSPPPYKCVVGTVAGGFQDSFQLHPIFPVFQDLANAGFLCLAHYVRLLKPIPTQTTSGAWPQQYNDLKIGIRAMRSSNPFGEGFTTTGFVAALSGSGGASSALCCSLDGTEGDDKADASVCMSPPTDFSDRNRDVTPEFIQATGAYAQTSDIPTLKARSPISLNLSAASPILHYNGNHESMPLTQFTLFGLAMANSGAQGYSPIENTGTLGADHSFAMWPYIKPYVIEWLKSK